MAICIANHIPDTSKMDSGDWIFLGQTIIVLLTGGIVFYYARETHRLPKTSERHIQIAAKTGLLAAYMQDPLIIESRNFAWESQGKMTRQDASGVTEQIQKLEAEINKLISESN